MSKLFTINGCRNLHDHSALSAVTALDEIKNLNYSINNISNQLISMCITVILIEIVSVCLIYSIMRYLRHQSHIYFRRSRISNMARL